LGSPFSGWGRPRASGSSGGADPDARVGFDDRRLFEYNRPGESKILLFSGEPMQDANRSTNPENELYIKLFITNGGGW